MAGEVRVASARLGAGGGVKVALVHDWLVGMRGGEKCLDLLCEMLPGADIFTLVHEPGSVSPRIEARPIRTSLLQNVPFARRHYPKFLPVLPWAVEQLDLAAYDAVVSVSHCVAKGVLPRPGAWHGCWCLTPMRYIWDARAEYFGAGRPLLPSLAGRFVGPWLRMWDAAASARVDSFAAISQLVRKRIERFYGRTASVLHPPIDDRFLDARVAGEAGRYFLVVGAPAPNKRLEVAIEAFRELGLPLVVAGSGPATAALARRAPNNVTFFGWCSDDELVALYQGARALVFPGYDDFGLTPLEAAALGRPTIAFAGGGALETIVGASTARRVRSGGRGRDDGDSLPAPTGVLYARGDAAGLADAVRSFTTIEEEFDPMALRAHASRFSRAACKTELTRFFRQGIDAEAIAAC